jgi:RNA polymerase-binding transcription factor DksA
MPTRTSSDGAWLEKRLRAMRVDLLDALRARLPGAFVGEHGSFGTVAGEDEHAIETMLTATAAATNGAACNPELAGMLATLHDIDGALQRIEFDVGGVCTGCGALIPMARLRDMPAVATCAACAQPAEPAEPAACPAPAAPAEPAERKP